VLRFGGLNCLVLAPRLAAVAWLAGARVRVRTLPATSARCNCDSLALQPLSIPNSLLQLVMMDF
jgi:hypothetical protein